MLKLIKQLKFVHSFYQTLSGVSHVSIVISNDFLRSEKLERQIIQSLKVWGIDFFNRNNIF